MKRRDRLYRVASYRCNLQPEHGGQTRAFSNKKSVKWVTDFDRFSGTTDRFSLVWELGGNKNLSTVIYLTGEQESDNVS